MVGIETLYTVDVFHNTLWAQTDEEARLCAILRFHFEKILSAKLD